MKLARSVAFTAGATLLAAGVGVGLASPAFASGQYCHNANDFNACASINGAGDVINWGEASATSDGALTTDLGSVYADAHVQLVSPSGATLCNSSTVAITKAGISMSCTWQAGSKDYPTGNYCTKVWAYLYVASQYDWQWLEEGAPVCLDVT